MVVLILLLGAGIVGGVVAAVTMVKRPLLVGLAVIVPPLLLVVAGLISSHHWVSSCDGGACDLGALYFLAWAAPGVAWFVGAIVGVIVEGARLQAHAAEDRSS
jgi:hypothetical protein